MLIDWFTVIAQIVNFLILMALMKLLLFDRIIKAVDQREASIQGRIEEAKEQRRQAEAKNEELRKREKEIESRREQVLQEARAEADQRRSELLERARKEADQRKAQWLESLEAEKEHFLRSFAELSTQGALDMARRALQDLADADLNAKAAAAFVLRLENLPDGDVSDFAQGMQDSGGEVAAVCGLDFDDDSRREIEQALADTVGREPEVEWSVSRDAGFGLSLKAGGRTLSWSLDAYMKHLGDTARSAIDARLEQQGQNQGEDTPDAQP